MPQTLPAALRRLRDLERSKNLTAAEKEIVQHVITAIDALERRLAALEGEQNPTTAPLDTPQGENAPLSR